MARDTSLNQQRNTYIKSRFNYHKKQNPKWMMEYVIEKVATEFYLSPATISKILKAESLKVPAPQTVLKVLNATAEDESC